MNNILRQFITAKSSCISMEGKAMSRLPSLIVLTRNLFAGFFLLVSASTLATTYYDHNFNMAVPPTSMGVHTVTFDWFGGLVPGIYYLQEKKNNGSWNTVYSFDWSLGPSFSIALAGRTSGTYTYRVKFVVNSNGHIYYGLNKSVVVSAVPGVPSSISTSSNQDNHASFSISWGTASGTVSSYELEQQFNGGAWGQVYSGAGTSESFSGLADGSYNYRVKACNNDGCSAYQTTSSAYVVTSPTSSTTSAIHSIRKSHKIDWSASTGTIDNYQLYRKFNDDNWTLVYEGLGLTSTFSDLADGHYQYWVRACNTEGAITTCSDYQASDRLTLSYIDTPTDLIVPIGDADGAYTISWQPGQGTTTSYTLQEQINGGTWATVQDTTDTSYIASGKTNNQYSYQVRGCNAGGCTDYTAAQTVNVLLAGQPGPITGPSTLEEVDDFSLAWGTASGTVTRYELEEQAEGGTWNPIYSGSDLTQAFTDHNFGTYNYRVRACNNIGCGSYTADKTVSITFTVPPQDPPTPFDVASNLTSLVSQAEIATTDTVGSVGGSFRVDESGAATYSVPIATVKGTAGVVPQISLNYSSQAGNGLMGKGWSIGGLSAVTRCRQTLSQDKSAKAITWSAEDRFCLDGQRLIVDPSSNYGDVGATYKTEIDSFAKVTSVGGSNGHPDYFTVERKDGSTSTYGGTGDIDAEQVARNSSGSTTTKTLTWALDRFEDSVGNPIEFDYLDDTDGHRIDRIKYAYGLNSSHGAHIDFLYEGRDDDISGYVAGYEFKNTQRLKTIKSYNGTNAVRQYNLAYASVSSSNNKTSRLDSIEECIAASCLPKTEFTWSMPQTGFASSPASTQTLSTQSDRTTTKYLPADINGDGIQDLIWQEPDWDNDGHIHDQYWYYMIGNGNGGFGGRTMFYTNSGNPSVPDSWEVIDYNADGRMDFITYLNGVWQVFLSKPQSNGSWALTSSHFSTGITKDHAIFTDVNSDGLVDALYRVQSANTNPVTSQLNDIYTVYRRPMVIDTTQGAGSSKPYKFGSASAMGTYDTSANDTSVLFTAIQNTFLKTAGDLNGDGQSDLYTTNTPGYFYGGGNPYVYRTIVTEGTSSREFHLATHQSTNVIKEARFADINGDGLADNLSYNTNGTAGWYIRLSNGTSFKDKVRVTGITGNGSTRSSVQLVDINNDGHPDFVWHDKTAQQMKARLWSVSSNNFTTTINLRSTDGNVNNGRLFLDMTGDGVLDYVLFKNDKLYTYPGNVTDDATYLVTNITNGLGAETEITYTSLADDNHYQTWGYNQPDSIFGVYNKTSSSAFYTALKNAWNPTLPSGSQTLNILSPVLEFSAPTQVVARVDSSAPKAGASPGSINTSAMSAISYYYGEARLQAAGRGFLGFERIKTKDEQTGVETTTTYRQDWPFIGHPLKTEVRSAQGHLLSQAENTWKLKTLPALGLIPLRTVALAPWVHSSLTLLKVLSKLTPWKAMAHKLVHYYKR